MWSSELLNHIVLSMIISLSEKHSDILRKKAAKFSSELLVNTKVYTTS
jgi:hypothetical protein